MPHRCGSGIELLADPTRRRLVAELALRPSRPSRLATRVSLSRPAVSRQLRLLSDAGLITGLPYPGDARSILYTVNPMRRGVIIAWLAGTEIGRPTDPDANR